MRKLFSSLLLIVLILSGCMAAQAAVLPASLTEIENAAFEGDANLKGLLSLPSGVKRVGADAFSGTGLYALSVPAGAEAVGSQSFRHAAYVRINGAATTVGTLSGVRFVIAPEGSAAQSAANAAGLGFVAVNRLVEKNGFYYRDEGSTLTLMAAKDAAAIGSSVKIPDVIDGKPVTNVSSYAFIGCYGLKELVLPDVMEARLPSGALADCPSAAVNYYSADNGVKVNSVTANVNAGASGNSITWTVDAQADAGVKNYLYTVQRDGVVVQTKESTSAQFSYEAQAAGEYQLLVTVVARNGVMAVGKSPVLYIAVEAMIMTAPETLQAGEDLTIGVVAIDGAVRYSVYVTKESTGELISNRSTDKAGDVTIKGYLLEPGKYRITGYVHGNDFRYTVPTVRYVAINGEIADGPVIPEQEPVRYLYDNCRIRLSDTEPFVVRYQFVYSDGSKSTVYTTEITEPGKMAFIGTSGTQEQWKNGGKICIWGAVKHNDRWTSFGGITEVQVIGTPRLDEPVFSVPATVAAGADFSIMIEKVENTQNYHIEIHKGYTAGTKEFYDEPLFVYGSQDAGRILIEGCEANLKAGIYTVVVHVNAENYEHALSTARLEVTGTHSAAPTVTVDKNVVAAQEKYAFTIGTAGIETVRVKIYYGYPSQSQGYEWNRINVIEDVTLWRDSRHEEGDFYYTFAAMRDGRWSAWSTPIKVTISDSAGKPEVTMPSTLPAGQDLVVEVNPVSNATDYYVNLYNRGNIRVEQKSISGSKGGTVTFAGYYFSPGRYRVVVSAYGSGGSSSTEAEVTVVAATRPGAPAATADSNEGRLNVSYGFTIPSTLADQVAVRYYREDDTNNVTYKTITATGDSTRWLHRQYSAGYVGTTWNYSFAVQVGGVWSTWSSALPVTITNREQLAQAELTLPRSVQAGADVTISFQAVEHADSYTLYLYQPNGSSQSWSAYPGNERVISGYDLSNGTYRVVVEAKGAEYDSSKSEKTFIVSGVRSAAPVVSVDKAEVFSRDNYSFMIESADCELIAYRYVSSGGSSVGTLNVLSDLTVWETYSSSAGIISYSFCTMKDGLWSAWSTVINVTVKERPVMDKPVVTLPDSVQKGSDLTVTFAPVEDAAYYYLYLQTIRGQSIKQFSLREAGSHVVEGYLLPDNYVRVLVYAYSNNGGRSETEKLVKVVSAVQSAAPAVTLASGTITAGSYATFTINTPGAAQAAVRFYRVGTPNDVTYSTINVTGASTQWKNYRYNTGEIWAYSFAVQVNGQWSEWSEFVQVAVQ